MQVNLFEQAKLIDIPKLLSCYSSYSQTSFLYFKEKKL